MIHLGMIFLAYLAGVLHVGLSGQVALGRFTPHFLLLLVPAALFLFEGGRAIAWAAVAGLLSDCLGPDRLGIDMLSATVTALVVQHLIGPRPSTSVPAVMLVCFVAIFTILLSSATLRIVVAERHAEALPLLMTTAGMAASSAAVGLAALLGWRLPKRSLAGRAGACRPGTNC